MNSRTEQVIDSSRFHHPFSMRLETNRDRVLLLMQKLGEAVRGAGRVYFTGGASAVLLGWREMTVDVDFMAEPEPAGFFEALPALKEQLDINLELASPPDFIPELPGWTDRRAGDSCADLRRARTSVHHMNQQPTPPDTPLSGLPGGEYLRDGLADQAAGRETISSLLVEIAAPRLVTAGVPVPALSQSTLAAEIRLYRLLQSEHGLDAFSQYNALLRRRGKLMHGLDRRAHECLSLHAGQARE